MEAGKLNKRITIQANALTRDTNGAEVDSWTTVATVWAAITTDAGREFYAAQKINAETTAVMRIRYRAGLNPRMRVLYAGKYFNILHINNVNEANKEILLLCREVI